MTEASLDQLYRPSLALLTDLYQLTMAYGYWKSGMAGHDAVFHLSFRTLPFGGGYAIGCGLHHAIDMVQGFRLEPEDLDYLAKLRGNDDSPMFERGFLDYLQGLRLTCDLDAVPEGTSVFPHEPLLRVRGPIIQCQLLETPLLNVINFQTLIATKAARICSAAAGMPVLEFGLRRAQGPDGGLSASRAAYVGGCAATSNVLAGRLFGIPVRGTHAHSWVMAFGSEIDSFLAYADAMPNNCVMLVDTYDSLEGVRNAITVGRRLREKGHELAGIRLDSGDLAWLSKEARRMLDDAGFERAAIVASNDLDETIIESLISQGARVGVWGVGTRLVTAHDEPSLGGVYKLSAVRPPGSAWQHRLKVSEQAVKTSNPGVPQVRRFLGNDGRLVGDIIFDELTDVDEPWTMIDPVDPTRRRVMASGLAHEDLLVPIFRGGQLVYRKPDLEQVRARVPGQLRALHDGIKRRLNPHAYPVGLEAALQRRKTAMVLQARGLQ